MQRFMQFVRPEKSSEKIAMNYCKTRVGSYNYPPLDIVDVNCSFILLFSKFLINFTQEIPCILGRGWWWIITPDDLLMRISWHNMENYVMLLFSQLVMAENRFFLDIAHCILHCKVGGCVTTLRSKVSAKL